MLWEMDFWSKCSIFHTIFKYMIFQRPQEALSWSKGLTGCLLYDEEIINIVLNVFCGFSDSIYGR